MLILRVFLIRTLLLVIGGGDPLQSRAM